MSDKKRSVAEIQSEYTQLCAKAGHLQYSIYALKLDLDLVNEQLKDLNIEGAAAQKAEAESAKVADEAGA
jgi:hypothetical protein